MEWLRAHLYIASLVGAGLLILIGAFVVSGRTALVPQGSNTLVWGTGSYLLNPTANAPSYAGGEQKTIYSDVRSGPPFYYNPAPVQNSSGEETTSEFDFDAFLTMLSGPPKGSGVQSDTSLLDAAYSFIPGGLISTSTLQKNQTHVEQTLYTYGNEAGSTIQSFEGSFRSAPQILKDQFEDRENPAKNEALLALAGGLSDVGRALGNMEQVPPEVKSAHTKVAESYKELGEKLSRIPSAKTEQELLDLILSYNGAVETYVKNYVALATLLSAYGVTFAPDDPGSVFTFTNASL